MNLFSVLLHVFRVFMVENTGNDDIPFVYVDINLSAIQRR